MRSIVSEKITISSKYKKEFSLFLRNNSINLWESARVNFNPKDILKNLYMPNQ